jgi:hypothetical protein
MKGIPMFYPEDAKRKTPADRGDNSNLVLDGTVFLDDAGEDQVPRVKGLIELILEYLGKRADPKR